MPSASDWLESLSPWPEEFGLGRMRALLAELGEPQRAFRAIHVVGTNGKSTATRRAAAFLAREGLRVGAYTSPHVAGWSERIQVDGEDADLEQALERVRPAAERLGATQFEVLTAAALAEFAAAASRWRWSRPASAGGSTRPTSSTREVVALTNVALDHTEVLGETREAIAEEKLAVVAPGATVVLGEPEWASRARARGAAAVVVADDVGRAAAEAFLGRRARRRRRGPPARPLRRGRRRRLRRRPQPGRGRAGCSNGSRVATTWSSPRSSPTRTPRRCWPPWRARGRRSSRPPRAAPARCRRDELRRRRRAVLRARRDRPRPGRGARARPASSPARRAPCS